MTRIAVVDDDRKTLEAISQLLEADGFEVAAYSEPERALTAMRRKAPDLAILDTQMPRLDGLDLLRQLHQHCALPVMLLNAEGTDAEEIVGFRIGAEDVVPKTISDRVFLERVRAIAKRVERAFAPPGLSDADRGDLEHGPLFMDPHRHRAAWRGQPVDLTRIEFHLPYFLAKHPGCVRTRDAIQDHVYDANVYVLDRNIDSHVKRVRKKLKSIDPDFAAIETLYGIGYRFEPPAEMSCGRKRKPAVRNRIADLETARHA